MRTLAAIALALVLLVAAAACGADDDGTAVEETPSPVATTPTPAPTPTPADTATPTPTPAPSPSPTAVDEPAGEATTVRVYYVRDHESGVWLEPETVTLDEPTVAVARAAISALLTEPPAHPDHTSLLGADATLHDVDLDGDVLTIDLGDPVSGGLGAAYEAALVQQLAHTGAQFDTVRAVRLLVDGDEVESLAGHVDTSRPIEPDPLALAPVTITSHAPGASVPAGEVTLAGEACTFEATIELAVTAPDGSTSQTHTTASSGCPERGTWEHALTLDAPGTWTITATEPDPSDGEGRPPYEVSITLDAG